MSVSMFCFIGIIRTNDMLRIYPLILCDLYLSCTRIWVVTVLALKVLGLIWSPDS